MGMGNPKIKPNEKEVTYRYFSFTVLQDTLQLNISFVHLNM